MKLAAPNLKFLMGGGRGIGNLKFDVDSKSEVLTSYPYFLPPTHTFSPSRSAFCTPEETGPSRYPSKTGEEKRKGKVFGIDLEVRCPRFVLCLFL